MFRISLLEGMKNIKRRKVLTGLTVLLFAFLFILQGYTYSYYAVNEIKVGKINHESLKEYHMYSIGSKYPPALLVREYSENIDIETAEFYETLDASEYIKYVGLESTGLSVIDFKGDPKIFYSMSGSPYTGFSNEEWETNHSVAVLTVTPNFHKGENYRVIEGRDFTDEDMPYVEGKPRPVLLGYKYKDVYKIGDLIDIKASNSSYKSQDITQIEVIGILAEDTSVVTSNGEIIWDLDKFIVFPRYSIPVDEWDNYGENVIKSAVNTDANFIGYRIKFLLTSENETLGLQELNEAINDYSQFGKHYRIVNRKLSMEKMQSRTEALTSFYEEITAVLMFFAVVTVLISITNRVSRNMKDYAIHIAIGATKKSAVLFIISEMSIILLCSTVIGMFATKWIINSINMPFYFWQSLAIYVATSVVILALSAVITLISIRKYDICNLIK